MEIILSHKEDYVILTPQGEVDANTSSHLDDQIAELIAANFLHILIDCSELVYISSAGLGVFISYLDELDAKNGKFVFSNMKEGVFDVFQLLGLDQVLTIVPDNSQAEEIFSTKTRIDKQ